MQVQEKIISVLFGIILQYGKHQSEEGWLLIFETVLYPLFDILFNKWQRKEETGDQSNGLELTLIKKAFDELLELSLCFLHNFGKAIAHTLQVFKTAIGTKE